MNGSGYGFRSTWWEVFYSLQTIIGGEDNCCALFFRGIRLKHQWLVRRELTYSNQ